MSLQVICGVVHYTPEEHDQPACDADTAEDAPAVMFGTLNPDRVTCPACQEITGEQGTL